MAGLRLTRAAREDLKAIGRYTQRTWGRRQRTAYLTQLDRRFHALAEMPSLGRSCDDIRPGYRKDTEGAHVIFYREVDGGIEIVRILHGRMDLDRHF
jgi:toxin ParE1/3/4